MATSSAKILQPERSRRSEAVFQEWSTWNSTAHDSTLRDLLEDDEVRALADRLTRSRRLTVRDLRTGPVLESTSFVGAFQLGRLRVVIRPKLEDAPLLALLRYAFGLRALDELPDTSHPLAPNGFQDLLATQLHSEVSELIRRGLHRSYVRRKEWLTEPRGRIDVGAYAQRPVTVALPCIHHPRLEDNPLNRVLRSGIALASRAVGDAGLRRRLQRLDAELDSVLPQPLTGLAIAKVLAAGNRMTSAYGPALKLIQLLHEGQGLDDRAEPDEDRLPGFLFDMNRFFQALLSRFLHDHLVGSRIRDEFALRGLITYRANPRRRPAHTPRPDFAVIRDGRVAAFLDAKYRDLWEQELPREMLYQLALYALASPAERQASILYPTLAEEASEQIVELRLQGGSARIAVRPVPLIQLAELIRAPTSTAARHERERLAMKLAFGGGPGLDFQEIPPRRAVR